MDDRRPIISSVVANPSSIGPADSTTVVCTATDPDNDVLVFDFITDARLRPKGALPNDFSILTSHSNSQVFYPGPASLSVIDTAWIQCFARDRRGMSDNRLITVLVRH